MTAIQAIAPMRTRFAMVPRWVYTRVTDAAALRVYVHLAGEYCDTDRYCFPSEARLAEELGCTPRTIQRALRVLQNVGALRVIRSRKTSGHWGRNSYILPMDDPHDVTLHPQPDQCEQGIAAGRHHATNMSPGRATDMSCRELDPQKQPHSENKQIETSRFAPSDDTDDQADVPTAGDTPDAAGLSVPAGLDPNPNPGLDEDATADPAGDHVGEVDAPGPWTLDEITAWLNSPEYLKGERLIELIEAEVEYFENGGEDTLARDMLDRGEHWRKVVATILKQRRTAWGAVGGYGGGPGAGEAPRDHSCNTYVC